MNSPLVVEQAKKLVALLDFSTCLDDKARIQFLYHRVYQRPPRPEEIELGLEFVAQTPAPEEVAAEDSSVVQVSTGEKKLRAKQLAKQQNRKGDKGAFHKREPLKAWEEYAHALLQANETSFVN
jgi:hypothetical protein